MAKMNLTIYTYTRTPRIEKRTPPPPSAPGTAFKYLPSKPIQLVCYDLKEFYGRSRVSPHNYPTGLPLSQKHC